MASVSYSITVDQNDFENDRDITVGAAVPGTGDFELRVNTAKFTNLWQIMLALEKFELRLLNSQLGPTDFKVL